MLWRNLNLVHPKDPLPLQSPSWLVDCASEIVARNRLAPGHYLLLQEQLLPENFARFTKYQGRLSKRM